MSSREQEKWNRYYSSLSPEEPPPLREFSREFAEWIETILPPGKRRTLEAGCGAGYQSAALAERPGFETSLLDFSGEALRSARELFASRKLTGDFHQADIHSYQPAGPLYDLVFNVGVLEHYEFAGQVRLLRAMAQCSNGYVVAVVPNSRCYWYWISRIRNAAHGNWPFGIEMPASSLRPVFEAAGLRIVAEAYLGGALTTSFISALPEIEEPLKELICGLHAQGHTPKDVSAYLYAAVGTVDESVSPRLDGQFESDANRALAADSVASMIAMRIHERFLEERVAALEEERKTLSAAAANESARLMEQAAQNTSLREQLQQLQDALRAASSKLEEQSELLVQEREAHLAATTRERARQAELGAEIELLQRQVNELHSALDREAAKLTEYARELDAARRELHTEKSLREFSTSGLQIQARRLASALDRVREELRVEMQRAQTLQSALDSRTNELSEARASLQHVVLAIRKYKSVLNSVLHDYSRQRAWRLMVALRRLYSVWFNSRIGGRISAFLEFLLNPFARENTYPEYEIVIPSPDQYVILPQTQTGGAASAPPQPAPRRSLARQPLQRAYDVIVLAIIDFDFRYQRPQQIAAQFAANGHRVFWVSPTRFVAPDDALPYRMEPLRENLWEVHLRGRQPDIYMGELAPDSCDSFRASLLELCQDWASSEVAVIVQLPFWRRLAMAVKPHLSARICYDCMDEWDSFQNIGPFIRSEEALLVHEADVVFASAERLVRKFAQAKVPAILVRNGVDYSHFANSNSALPDATPPKPIIGYYGAIADWIDLDLIAEVATLRPQYSFVLIGQVFNRDVSRLEALPNVYLLGHKPYDSLPAYLRSFDVCHIPFLLNEVTAATDPVKLYEYLSLGKPVVSTSLSELEYCKDLVLLADQAPEYAAALDRALAMTSESDQERRRQFARNNTWLSRVAAMNEAITAAMPNITVLIVTHNSGRYIDSCLSSLRRNSSYPNLEVIVIDNASTDDTLEKLALHAASWNKLKVIPEPVNLGFAAGNNRGAREADGKYLVLLNADTVVTPGWCGRLLRALLADTRTGLVSAVTNFAGNEVKVSFDYDDEESMEEFAVQLASSQSGKRQALSVAPLFCSMLSLDLYRDAGGLDEQFDVGMFEDDDFSMSIRQRGLQIVTAEDCFIHHFGQGSFAQLSSDEYEAVFSANRQRYEAKWNVAWQPHQLRPGVKGPLEDRRFTPELFSVNRIAR